ncbi:MAG: hypothetical protein M3165_10160 [Actinomycetota bacterium]|nr:hypothetical protein [Actinomycetota bacterium]
MTSPRHRGSHTGSRRPTRSAQAVAALLVGAVVAGSFAAVRALAGAADDPGTTSFTGVVTEFADDGALMCVRRRDSADAPFCDLYYVPPDTPPIQVGDRVMVDTITSRAEDGSRVSGMLVTPLP